ncbi:MAG: FAD-binding oxidoreductase [Chloroflexota bacterium]
MKSIDHFPEFGRITTVQGYGGARQRAAYLYRPAQPEHIGEIFHQARKEGFSVGLYGSGRSYGDAPLNSGNILLDLRRLNRILDWNPDTGVVRLEPGVTIQQLWQHMLEDGWWPSVVPGTMFPTVGGCLAMNVHGKNNYTQGTFGEHVLEFSALLPTGAEITCSPKKNSDLFHALIGGSGLLGVFTSITLQLKRVYSGDLWVQAWAAPSLRRMMAEMEELKSQVDYIVGWVDGVARGSAIGRGQLHSADYLPPGEDAQPYRTLSLGYQNLPDTFFGLVPASILWRLMAPWMNNLGVRMVNLLKYLSSATIGNHKRFRQPHAAFHFLLDYIPNWRMAYGREGLIQYQCFISSSHAVNAFEEILRLTHKRGLPSYLGVVKCHRPDVFLLSHAVDGFSLALDFKVTRGNRVALQRLTDALDEIVLEAGGRFYLAKDSTLKPEVFRKYLGEETLQRFWKLKHRCDPECVLQNDLYRRLFVG